MIINNINKLLLKKPLIKLRTNTLLLSNNTIYNPIIGSNLGIPLNILQYISTTTYFGENIINYELINLQFAIGIFTYGTDRLFDALEYKKNQKNEKSIYSIEKQNYYQYLLNNLYINYAVIFSSYIYIIYILYDNEKTYFPIILLTSTLGYKSFKENFGILKAFYIGVFWTIGTTILPIIYYENNYNILDNPSIYLPIFFSMFASSNLLDIKDLEEDKKENIYTLPVIYGKQNSISISHIGIVFALLIIMLNENFYNNIFVSSLFELQTFSLFFLNFKDNNNNEEI